MDDIQLSLPLSDVRRLLGAANGDAALLYLYLRTGAAPDGAAEALHLPVHRVDAALASLRQLGLWEEPKARPAIRPQAPLYTEADVLRATERSRDFPLLVGEAQRRLGRILSTEELKILLSMTDYLGLPAEVIGVLIHYCIQRARLRGQTRAPSLRTIEKEGYRWADEGIDTLEEASFFVQNQLQKETEVGRIQARLQLTGRRLTGAENRYILSWLDMGFDEEAIALAYEKTCLNTGGMKWPYCNSILRSWHEKNLHTVAEIQAGDSRPASNPRRPGPPVGSAGQAPLGELEKDALARLLKNHQEV